MNAKQIAEIKQWDAEHVIYPWKTQGWYKPILMERAEGIHMFSAEGKRYIDFCSGLLNINIGHGNQHVLDAMKAQMDKLCYVASPFTTEPKARLAKMISEVTPGDLDYVFFTNAGAEAIENAIKAVRWFTGRQKIYSNWRGYHGATSGCITLTGDPRRIPCEPGIPGAGKFFGPYCYRCPFGYESEKTCKIQCLETLKTQIMLEGPKTIAGIFMEPIVGTNGIIIPPVEFMKGVRQICDENGILLVMDEVMAGWGRSGKWFGCEHFGVVPDIICAAKGLTSGYVQLGVMIWSKKVWDFFKEKPFVSGLTYYGHALACATGVANLEVYKSENLIEKSRINGDYLNNKLWSLYERHPSIGDVRCKGLWACLELVSDRKTKAPLAGYADSRMNVMGEFTKRILDMGLWAFAKWDFIFLAPPLIITPAQIDEAVAILDKALEHPDSLLKK
ncbi:MAG: aminotransferase class III-fold pyridoxal phosphate-dependent enzyme [Verrucomicrobia bacterium]|nr:aminotransferase class III-fold pyridoxal phosphate-dependent enzyme [Verrucomicrobiota bacterium]